MALNSAFDPQKPNPSCMIASGEGATRGVFVELTSAVVIASPIFDRVDPGPCREPSPGERSRGKRAAPSVRRSPKRSIEGGSVDELLDVTVERPVLDQFKVEV